VRTATYYSMQNMSVSKVTIRVRVRDGVMAAVRARLVLCDFGAKLFFKPKCTHRMVELNRFKRSFTDIENILTKFPQYQQPCKSNLAV